MHQEIKHPVLIAAALAIMLAGCNKKEEVPAPAMSGAEAPASQAAPSESMPVPEAPAPGMMPESAPPEKMAPDTMPGTPPSQ